MRCAVVNEIGDVVNVIAAQETDPAPAGFLFVKLKEGTRVSPGQQWSFDPVSKVFTRILIESAED